MWEEKKRVHVNCNSISPLNFNVFMDKDFTPSYSTSTRSHLPQRYPKCSGYLEGEESESEDEASQEEDESGSSDAGSDDEMEDDREEGPSNHAGKPSIQSHMHTTLTESITSNLKFNTPTCSITPLVSTQHHCTPTSPPAS